MPEPISLIIAGISAASALGSAGIGAATSSKNKKKDKELAMKSRFASSQPTGGGYSQGPNSIGSIIGTIGKVAGQVGKLAMENPEITKAALGATTNIGSQLIANKQNKNKGAYMKGIDKSKVAARRAGKTKEAIAGRRAERREAIADRRAKGREAIAERQATQVAAGEAPAMMGYNPLSKHMGGRGVDMMGKKPMMMGENVIVRDSKSGGKNQYNKRGK